MKVSDFIGLALKHIGVEYVFGYQGANISHLIDSIGRLDGITFVTSYNEQGAAFCANGYSQIRRGLGVAIASSGPGAINLLSGIANSYFDSIPCLFITGNVGLGGMRKNSNIRQNSFQELDIVSMTKGITKYSVMVDSVECIPAILEKAIHIAFDGRMGAVHIDIPHDIQKGELPDKLISYPSLYSNVKIGTEIENFATQYLRTLENTKKPLLLIGAGMLNSMSKKEVLTFIDKLGIPYVASLKGLSAVNCDSFNFIGFIGDYGNRYANLALYHCDTLLILGSRIDHRQTGGDLTKFAPNASIFRVDIDEHESNRVAISENLLRADIHAFTQVMVNRSISMSCKVWRDTLNNWKKKFPSLKESTTDVHINSYLSYLGNKLKQDYIVCGDVGQSQMAVAQSFPIKSYGKLLNSGGLGAMGYALPASIGAKFASPGAIIIAIAGDGGIQMNIQELQMIQREKLNINIIIVNNNCLGMICQYQNLALEARHYGSQVGYKNPEFSQIAKAYNFRYLKIESIDDYESSLSLINSNNASIIEVSIGYDIELIPEMGNSIIAQVPKLPDSTMEELIKEGNI